MESTPLKNFFVNSSPSTSFDIIQFFKSSIVTIFTVDCLKKNPKELDRLVEFIKGESCNNSQLIGETSNSIEALFSINGDV